MADPGLRRTQYWNVSAGALRVGSTGHGESLTDFDNYLTPLELLRNRALLDWGIADGLTVLATAGAATLMVLPGTAFDAVGRPVVLSAGSLAVVDPTVDPSQVLNVPTVLVPAAGLPIPTAAPGGELLVTLTWREVQVDGALGNVPVLAHAPWVRLVAADGFADVGDQVVLAAVTVSAEGAVTALVPGLRRYAGSRTSHIELTAPVAIPGAAPNALAIGQQPSARLDAVPGGGLTVTVPGAGGPSTALSVDGPTAAVAVPVSLATPRLTTDALTTTTLSTSALRWAGSGFEALVGADGGWRLRDTAPGADRMVVDASGQLSVGLPEGTSAQRVVHVEGSEVHSGGAAGGFSFADRTSRGFNETPGSTGQRWVWYASDGLARLWSSVDILTASPGRRGPFTHFVILPTVTVLGNLVVTGSISKGGGGFRIDHPLDPQRRLLQHAFVESPEMSTLYTGTAVTGEDGLVEVVLPGYFAALNRDARVHLSAVGSLASVTQAEPVEDNRFTIRSAEPSVTVNWLVTAVRDDPWARANRIAVEEDKAQEEQGAYLHPEVYE